MGHITYHEQHNRQRQQTDNDFFTLTNSGQVELLFDFYSGGDRVDVFQGVSKGGESLRVASNTDRIINAANTETFDANVYEDVVKCYRRVASLLLKNRETIEQNIKKIDLLITQRVKLLKRFLSAG